MPKELLKECEVVKMLGVSQAAFKRMVIVGRLPKPIDLKGPDILAQDVRGHDLRWSRLAIEEWLSDNCPIVDRESWNMFADAQAMVKSEREAEQKREADALQAASVEDVPEAKPKRAAKKSSKKSA